MPSVDPRVRLSPALVVGRRRGRVWGPDTRGRSATGVPLVSAARYTHYVRCPRRRTPDPNPLIRQAASPVNFFGTHRRTTSRGPSRASRTTPTRRPTSRTSSACRTLPGGAALGPVPSRRPEHAAVGSRSVSAGWSAGGRASHSTCARALTAALSLSLSGKKKGPAERARRPGRPERPDHPGRDRPALVPRDSEHRLPADKTTLDQPGAEHPPPRHHHAEPRRRGRGRREVRTDDCRFSNRLPVGRRN